MTPTGEKPPGSVADRLMAEPYCFDFFAAVRLLERMNPTASPVGGDGIPSSEPVRFRVHNSTVFPPSQITTLTSQPNHPPELTVAFFGLTGPSGVMPRLYTELIERLTSDHKAAERYTLRDWFDLFNHRLLSLFHRAWAKNRFWVQQERGDPWKPTPDTFTMALRSLVGLGTPHLFNRGKVTTPGTGFNPGPDRVLARLPDDTVLHFAGLFSQRPRTPIGLESLLSDYLGIAVKVECFRGQWLSVTADDRAVLSSSGSTMLASQPVLGERVWDLQSKFRVRIGPMNARDFKTLLPDPSPLTMGKRFYLLAHLIRLYCGPEYDVEVQLVLKSEDVPMCRLPRATEVGPRLGWNSWVVSMTAERDADQAVFLAAERPASRMETSR